MRRVKLGHSGIEVSPICIGGMSFGRASADYHEWTIGPEETRTVIKRALDSGVNFIDTANCYAHGTSEEYIGAALRDLGVRREDVVLASKVFFNEGGLSREAILREIDGTLSRLGTDYLDLYIIHRFDYDTPIEETMEALDSLVRAGKVRALGASAMYAYQLHNMQVAAERNGWTKFTSMQCHYNLLYREDEREMVPVCRQFGMAITPYSPLASGHLTRPTWEGVSKRATTDVVLRNKYDADRERDMPIVERVAEVAANHGVPMSRVALAWHWARGIEAPVVGCSKPECVDDAVAALDMKLSPEEVAYLEEPYTAHELVGPAARPGEKPLAGTTNPNAK
ncbi:aldo/keto reductase [uncultured Slackia sp.]|uniref:aldo/keto reductase n=1 Tax=uncultured Slackia sp. TaxID=665903 RepID=UPI0025EFD18B|nr:aldo/keto reductase [uncultured Slackia sp.]